ncbi:MAG TPA: carboxypeptidase-like regulatory domain-containing protein [Bacteroidia bacterium]|nr:carboxypeptidase-like regulatory domain-containing protein [Bacteroidia bacterium]
MNKFLILFFEIIFVLAPKFNLAQKEIIITGVVTDGNSDQSIREAKIVVVKPYQELIADNNGYFKFKILQPDTIKFFVSKEGYKYQEFNLPITTDTFFKISMTFYSLPQIEVEGESLNFISKSDCKYYISMNLSLAGYSSAEPDSVSVHVCNFQSQKLYLQTAKFSSHIHFH